MSYEISCIIKIKDINLEYLREIEYTEIKEMADDDLKKLLYFFVDNNVEELRNETLYGMGRDETRLEIAKNLLNLNVTDNDIIIATGITKEELENLKK